MSELGASNAEVLAQMRYDLPASYTFHRCHGVAGVPDDINLPTNTVEHIITCRCAYGRAVQSTGWRCSVNRNVSHALPSQAEVEGHRSGPVAICSWAKQ